VLAISVPLHLQASQHAGSVRTQGVISFFDALHWDYDRDGSSVRAKKGEMRNAKCKIRNSKFEIIRRKRLVEKDTSMKNFAFRISHFLFVP
jgi:hypothetical protein